MKREDLTNYDIKPEGMLNYLRYNGAHFNKKLCDFATSRMRKKNEEGRLKPISAWSREEVQALLEGASVALENDTLYDSTFVANTCKAKLLGSSIEDKKHVALYIKDVIDDDDAFDGMVFNRWYADMCKRGVVIEWDDMI